MTNEIARWLNDLGLGKYADVFNEHEVDFEVLPELAEPDLEKIGIPLGPRKKLMKAITELSADVKEQSEPTDAAPPTRAAPEAERRQLTLMFVDLVGSTELSQQLDPEDLREVMRRYQDAVTGVISRHDGYIAKYLGDGVLAYFGWPQAHEDQAERAVRAGLDAVRAVEEVPRDAGGTLQVRVGIASGQVVIGDLVGDAATEVEAISGETPNLAARLQGVAAPGEVVVGADTRRLLANAFDIDELAPQSLRGFSEPVPAWRIVGERQSEDRFEAAHTGRLTHFIGRQHELGLLQERWQLARDGEGQAVLISGEAGIGKSRLLRVLHERIAADRPLRLNYQCAPHRANSAFFPIIQRLERACRFGDEDLPGDKLDKLEALLRRASGAPERVAPLMAALLSLDGTARYGELELSAQEQRQLTTQALVDQVLTLSRARPLLLALEDAHWIDPTSESLMAEIMAAIGNAAAMVVITHRPDFQPSWHGIQHLTSIAMNRLSREQGTEIVRSVGGDAISDAAIDRIIQRADGVPLYVEELTKSVLEAGAGSSGQAAESQVPASLQASLAARLDHLGEAKDVAQIGSVIGRVFRHQLIEAVVDLPKTTLNQALDRIVSSELLFRRGEPPDAVYTFKHALVQDSAYASLLRGRRRELHARIAAVLTERFDGVAALEPELLAYHHTEAGDGETAVHYWLQAGRRAGERSAHLEAVAHLTKGIEILRSQPESSQRNRDELSMLTTLSPSLMATRGFAAEEMERTFTRIRHLCEAIGDRQKSIPALRGLSRYYLLRRKVETALSINKELAELAQLSDDSIYLTEASLGLGIGYFFLGRFSEADGHLERGLKQYEPSLHHLHSQRFGEDGGVASMTYYAINSWMLGYPDRARTHIEEAVARAETFRNALTEVYVSVGASWVYQRCRDVEATARHAEKALALSEKHGFAQRIADSRIMAGWAAAKQGRAKSGIDMIRSGLAEYRATGAVLNLDYHITLLAEAYLDAGDLEEASRTLDRITKDDEKSGYWLAELHRWRGVLMLQSESDRDGEAEEAFLRALETATAQEAPALRLRAATELARLQRNRGREGDALDRLASIFGQFTEGFDLPDLAEAKALLDELA